MTFESTSKISEISKTLCSSWVSVMSDAFKYLFYYPRIAFGSLLQSLISGKN